MEPKSAMRHSEEPRLALRSKLSGFAQGARVVTADGRLPIEHLTAGERIITRDGGMQRLSWIDSAYVTTHAVRIAPQALGHSKPEERTVLPEGQRLLLRDWRAKAMYGHSVVGVPAFRLADGDYVRRIGPRSLRLFRLGFERQHTVYVDGLEMLAHTAPFPQA